MRPSAVPLASHEVRWFFEGSSADHAGMRKWFEAADPFRMGPAVGTPIWKGRLDDHPDVYLLIPGADDIGIKWREGELQVKGRVSMTGAAEEVDAGAFVDRGLNAELTDLKIGAKSYCSLGFEAFPDDAAMHAAFSQAVATFLEGLAQDLGADRSQSYPQWLRGKMD